MRLGGLDPLYAATRLFGVGRWGPGVAAMVSSAAHRFPCRTVIEDDAGSLTYFELDRQVTSLASVLRHRAESEQTVGILARNHRGFVIAQIAAERAGLDLVLLSTALPVPLLRDVVTSEGIGVIVADREFLPLVGEALADLEGRTPIVVQADDFMADDSDAALAGPGIERISNLIDRWAWVPSPRRRSVLTLLTSGTTGAPKGARRNNRAAPGSEALALFEEVPYRVGDLYLIAPPLFHAWGLSQLTIALATASTVILRRRFDPDEIVETLRSREVDVLAVVPLMLRRILNSIDADATDGTATDRTGPDRTGPGTGGSAGMNPPRIVGSSGNVLSGDLSIEWMDRFGDRLYNFYGSTETGIGTIARPSDMRRAPGTVGRAPRGVTLSILDEEGMPLPPGETGTIFLSSSQQFDGYSDGSDRERNGSLMASNDLGYLDDHGLLHVNGRDGDMIVTGGENVFPHAVEEVLERQTGVDLAAVVGLPDTEFGQRIAAFVVPRPGEDLDVDRLRAEVSKELLGFMVPKEFHVVEALPMTTTGKVIRHQLAVLGDSDRV